MESPSAGETSPQQDVPDQTTSRLSKRLSLNFPILPPNSIQSGRASPSPRASTADPFFHPPATPTTSAGFLNALATQERRVLELREELLKAESELSKLKKQWATHEAQNKRNGIQDADLHVIKADYSKLDRDLVEESMGHSLLSREQETGSASKEGPKTRPRKVFSGSRSTRTLSLLSPNATNIRLSFTQTEEAEKENGDEAICDPKPVLSRSSTLSELQPQTQQPPSAPIQDTAPKRRSMPPPSRDALLRTSKQMASDFREGLWTFFEDLRQATVGEEGVNGTESRTSAPVPPATKPKSPKTRQHKHKSSPRRIEAFHDPSLRVGGSVSKAASVLGSGEGRQSTIIADDQDAFWKEYGMKNKSPSPQRPRTSRQAMELGPQGQGHLKSDDYDNWDIWDSPLPHKKKGLESSPAPSAGTFSTQRDSPCAATSSPATASPKAEVSPQNFSRPKSNLSPKREPKLADVEESASPIPVSYDNVLQWALRG
jgi:hypothetical protein